MAGKMLFNWIFGGIGFALTLIVSFSHNLFTTSLIRSAVAFVIWFLLGFVIRWILGLSITDPSSAQHTSEIEQETESIGNRVDLTTPDESEAINDLLKPSESSETHSNQGSAAFEPLNPPRLVKTIDRDPEDLAKAVRHLTEE